MRSPLRSLCLSMLCCLGIMDHVFAAAPSRTFSYVTGQTIDPSQVTTNEDNMFSYLQAGVDTYAAGSIAAAALADSAVTSAKILNGTITPADISGTPADDMIYVADSASAGTWRTLPNCPDTAGNHLNYTSATNLPSCGTSAPASGAVVGTFTRDESAASGTATISGLGITPKIVWVICSESGGVGQASWGISDGTTNLDIFDDYGVSANTMNTNTNAIEIRESAGNNVVGTLGSFASGQFVVTYTKTGSPTGTATCRYLAIP